MIYFGDIVFNQNVSFLFNTYQANGTPIAFTTPSISVYKLGVQTPANYTQANATITPNYNSITGLNYVKLITTDAWYARANDYSVVVANGTVDGTSVIGRVLANFSIESRAAAVKIGLPSYTTVIGDLSTLYAANTTGVASINTNLGYGVASINANLGLGVASINTNLGYGVASLNLNIASANLSIASISSRIGAPSYTTVIGDLSKLYLANTTGVASVNTNLNYGVASINLGIASISNRIGTPNYITIAGDISHIAAGTADNAGIASISARLGVPNNTIAADISNIGVVSGVVADNAGIASISARLGSPSYITVIGDISKLYLANINGVASINTNINLGVASINPGLSVSISNRIGSPIVTLSGDIANSESILSYAISSVNQNVSAVDLDVQTANTSLASQLGILSSIDNDINLNTSAINNGIASINSNIGYGVASINSKLSLVVASVNTNLGYGVASINSRLGLPHNLSIADDIYNIVAPNNSGIASISARLGVPNTTTIANDIANINLSSGYAADNAGIASISARLGITNTTIAGAIASISQAISTVDSDVQTVDSHVMTQQSILSGIDNEIALNTSAIAYGVASINAKLSSGVASINTSLTYGVASINSGVSFVNYKIGSPNHITLVGDIDNIISNTGIASISLRLGNPNTTIANDIANIGIVSGLTADNAGIASISARLGIPSTTIAGDIASIGTVGGGSGPIAYPIAYTVGGIPVPEVEFWVTSTDDLALIAGIKMTDSNGDVTFYLDAGTYNLHWKKDGIVVQGSQQIVVV